MSDSKSDIKVVKPLASPQPSTVMDEATQKRFAKIFVPIPSPSEVAPLSDLDPQICYDLAKLLWQQSRPADAGLVIPMKDHCVSGHPDYERWLQNAWKIKHRLNVWKLADEYVTEIVRTMKTKPGRKQRKVYVTDAALRFGWEIDRRAPDGLTALQNAPPAPPMKTAQEFADLVDALHAKRAEDHRKFIEAVDSLQEKRAEENRKFLEAFKPTFPEFAALTKAAQIPEQTQEREAKLDNVDKYLHTLDMAELVTASRVDEVISLPKSAGKSDCGHAEAKSMGFADAEWNCWRCGLRVKLHVVLSKEEFEDRGDYEPEYDEERIRKLLIAYFQKTGIPSK